MKVNNRLINISVNPKVHESGELVLEGRDDKVRTEVIDNIDNVKKVYNDFNPEKFVWTEDMEKDFFGVEGGVFSRADTSLSRFRFR